MLFIILFLLKFILSNTLNGNRPKIETYSKYKKTNGVDYRPKTNYTSRDDIDIFKIRTYFEKKWTINTLQNPNIPISEKMRILDENRHSPKSANIFAGGLMDKFDFEFYITHKK